MAKSFFIGIGGTGSRCLESLVHFCASGLGPPSLSLGIVDQDQANGNVARSRQIVDLYMRSRNFIRQPGENELSVQNDFMKTEIHTHQGDAVWCPLPNTASSLRKVFNYSILKPELKGLFDCLYSPSELDLFLEEGFRGKPHIGAAAILSNMDMESGFWRNIAAAINTARGGDDVNIFLAGSIFGGMGASGFPTIVRKLRRMLDEDGLSTGVKIGGALMLPYFSFPPPGQSDDQDVALSEAFLEQTQGALHYYHNTIKNQPNLFDSLYLVGWDPLIRLNYHQKGGAPQANPPMVPELYGCFAALDFFSNGTKNGGTIYQIGREDSGSFNWSDFPKITDDKNDTKNKLGNLLRFAFAYKFIYRQPLDRKIFKQYIQEAWYRRLIERHDVDLNNDDVQHGLKLIDDYSNEVLQWSASLIYSSSQSSGQPTYNLFDPSHYARYENDQTHIIPRAIPRVRKGFSSLIKGQTSSSLHNVYEGITYSKINTEHSGAGAFFGTLYESCAL